MNDPLSFKEVEQTILNCNTHISRKHNKLYFDKPICCVGCLYSPYCKLHAPIRTVNVIVHLTKGKQ